MFIGVYAILPRLFHNLFNKTVENFSAAKSLALL
jgi:hypothetical protein